MKSISLLVTFDKYCSSEERTMLFLAGERSEWEVEMQTLYARKSKEFEKGFDQIAWNMLRNEKQFFLCVFFFDSSI